MTLDGKPLKSDATLASDATNAVRRTAVIAVDVSNSMKAGGKFTEAKKAAQIFLDSAPKDLYVGIVTFAGKVSVAQRPSLDRAESGRVLDSLSLSEGTYLYDGLQQAVRTAGVDGQRSIIVLSDGRDTSKTPRASRHPGREEGRRQGRRRRPQAVGAGQGASRAAVGRRKRLGHQHQRPESARRRLRRRGANARRADPGHRDGPAGRLRGLAGRVRRRGRHDLHRLCVRDAQERAGRTTSRPSRRTSS